MPARRIAACCALLLMSCSLTGCGSISSFVAGGLADYIPAWAGGLPADAPPRPGTPAYDAYVKQHRQQFGDRAAPDAPPSASADAIH